jgi:hypothetical protein
VFYVAAPWKSTVEGWMRESIGRGEAPSVRDVMQRVSMHVELSAYRAEVPRYVERFGPLLRSEPASVAVDEIATVRSAEGYLVRRFGFRSISVHPERESAAHDPLGRRERARPGRPAFYLVPGVDRPRRAAEGPAGGGSGSLGSRA